MKDRLVLLGVAGLAAVATAGWMRQPQTVPMEPMVSSFQAPADLAIDPALPVATPAGFAPAPVVQRGVYRQTAQPVARQRASEARPVYQARTASSRSRAAVYDDDRPVVKERSTAKSAAIIGGSAAAGAAIGGLAGGGKGAAIGAIAGGAGGYVYDRATKNKEVRSREIQTDSAGYRSGDVDEYGEPRERRSTAKTAAIIGGGAAAGAAVGGIAGGGKGAAIGALAGGAGGYIYDRVTKNK